MACYLCNDMGYILSETGERTVCLECQHEVFSYESIKKVVLNRGDSKRSDRLLCSPGRATDRLSFAEHPRNASAEPNNRGSVSHYRLDPVLPDPQVLQLDSCSPHCPFCGTAPLVEEQMHGHYVCMNCHVITEGCCDGQSG